MVWRRLWRFWKPLPQRLPTKSRKPYLSLYCLPHTHRLHWLHLYAARFLPGTLLKTAHGLQHLHLKWHYCTVLSDTLQLFATTHKSLLNRQPIFTVWWFRLYSQRIADTHSCRKWPCSLWLHVSAVWRDSTTR